MNLRKAIPIFFVILSFVGCTHLPKSHPFKQNEITNQSMSRVYIYRWNDFAGSMWAHHFWINEVKVASLSTAGYTEFLIKPGKYQIYYSQRKDFKSLNHLMNFEPGKSYYFRESRGNVGAAGGQVSWTDSFALVQEPRALKELNEYQFKFQKPYKSVITDIPFYK